MYIKINNKKIKLNKFDSFIKRIKSLRFVLTPITEIYLFENKRGISTYWFCQRVDIVLTNEDDDILFIYPNIRSEKIIFPKRKVKKVYIFPTGLSKYLKPNKKLIVID